MNFLFFAIFLGMGTALIASQYGWQTAWGIAFLMFAHNNVLGHYYRKLEE